MNRVGEQGNVIYIDNDYAERAKDFQLVVEIDELSQKITDEEIRNIFFQCVLESCRLLSK